jgi:alkylated DNA repair dioxygenase AlkB
MSGPHRRHAGGPTPQRHARPSQPSLFGHEPAWPAGLAYAEALIDARLERELLDELARLPFEAARYKAYTARRRIVSYGSAYDFADNSLAPAPPVPGFLLPLRERLAAWAELDPTGLTDALVAEYAPGTPLGWHRDAPDFEHVVGVSLASACRMRFRPWPADDGWRARSFALVLAPRSAYVLRGDARWRWQHMIPPAPALRYSITFRTRRSRSRPAP